LWSGFGPEGTNLFSVPNLGPKSWEGGIVSINLWWIFWSSVHKERGFLLVKESQWRKRRWWRWLRVLPEEVEDDGTLQLAEEKRKRNKRSKRVMNLAHVVEDRELFICETERNMGGRKKSDACEGYGKKMEGSVKRMVGWGDSREMKSIINGKQETHEGM